MATKNSKSRQGSKADRSTKSKRSGSRNSRYADRNATSDSATTKDSYRNHISWYVPDANLLANVGNIPFGYRTGDALPVANGNYRLPGVTALDYIPTIGKCNGPSDPANVAATAIYQYIRHANSGSKNYDAVDLMLYLMAMDSIYTGILWCQRAIALTGVYTSDNRYYPRGIFEAMGVSFDDMVGNTNKYITMLNDIILKATTLAVPATFPLYQRHSWMVSHVFTDEANTNAQLFLFNPRLLYRFTLDAQSKGQLTPVNWHREVKSMNVYLTALRSMVDTLYGDEDAGLMTGDILKAYGDAGIFHLTTVMQDVSTFPLYDEEVLNQIHNATIVNAGTTGISQVIQDTGEGTLGYLVQNLTITMDSPTFLSYYNSNRLFDLHCAPSPEAVMRSTRLMIGRLTAISGQTNQYSLEEFGSEVVVSSVIYTVSGNTTFDIRDYSGIQDYMTADCALLLDRASQISYFPIIVMFNAKEAANGYLYNANTDRVTIISPENIEAMHRVAMLGLFNVPRLALGATEK